MTILPALSRRSFLGALASLPVAAAVRGDEPNAFTNEFFAMDTAMIRTLGTLLQRSDIELLSKLGYRGVGPMASTDAEWQHLVAHVIPWLDEFHLKLYAAYSWLQVNRGGFTIDPGLNPNIAALRGHGTFIWLPIDSKEFKPSDPAGDEMAVKGVQQIADEAAAVGCSVSIYPHYGHLVQRIADAVRVCEKVDRKNVSMTFNLCHWLRTDGPASMDRDLELAKPHLSIVTIDGADANGKDWPQLIQPLDQGNFNLAGFFRALQRIHYRGPIGLQGYDVAKNFHIEPSENLRRSMAAWKKLVGAMASHPA